MVLMLAIIRPVIKMPTLALSLTVFSPIFQWRKSLIHLPGRLTALTNSSLFLITLHSVLIFLLLHVGNPSALPQNAVLDVLPGLDCCGDGGLFNGSGYERVDLGSFYTAFGARHICVSQPLFCDEG